MRYITVEMYLQLYGKHIELAHQNRHQVSVVTQWEIHKIVQNTIAFPKLLHMVGIITEPNKWLIIGIYYSETTGNSNEQSIFSTTNITLFVTSDNLPKTNYTFFFPSKKKNDSKRTSYTRGFRKITN
jgi:hypothetical protein